MRAKIKLRVQICQYILEKTDAGIVDPGRTWQCRGGGLGLSRKTYSISTTDALRRVRRKREPLTFRLVQVLTGHGFFSKYLHRVERREMTPSCHDLWNMKTLILSQSKYYRDTVAVNIQVLKDFFSRLFFSFLHNFRNMVKDMKMPKYSS